MHIRTWFALAVLVNFGFSSAHAEWVLQKEVDPFTDKEQLLATNGAVVAWCDMDKGFTGGRPGVAIKTKKIPEALFYDNRSSYNKAINAPGADNLMVNIRYRFNSNKAKNTRADLAEHYTGVQLCNGWGPHCAKGFMRRMYVADQLIYEVDTAVEGKERGTIDLTAGRENLKSIMDSCGIKPKSYKGLGP